MLLSEIGDKEIIDLTKGSRHGKFWDAEMLFDETNGTIKALIVPHFQSKGKYSPGSESLQLPWSSIVKIGEDIIIFKS
ncbi:MAG TPA: YlmC/YmxH family sporulation protein [Anaerovoracaceae bacterium]|nr:YlmC/YmxH family sporulation protein [Anaerovoracaceae bacterium]